ncbi:hypothetical protein DRW41_19310 [Neobacillus piezotolerans]|uniref:Uncharacterized protein n=1 Tax=Neobacillus piezotolerans TaxID=2259171 RepID=A0A3D8GLP9_9BACI|nr:hypothetical protein [Neobacillus piezotolerans]RDU35262.1 hypothetical protein DRW41_19310 [Neobacillus piezotolerans]
MFVYYIHIAVPVGKPLSTYLASWEKSRPDPFMFDKADKFRIFRHPGKPVIRLAEDDFGNWYFMTFFTSKRLSGLKWARQSARPAYVEEGTTLPLVSLLEEEGLIPKNEGFDKAYAHTSVRVRSLNEYPPELQARLANTDGEDDPTVIGNIHFLRNTFEGKETRYIAGTETRSFATVTENGPYFNDIHLKTNAFLYLLYYVYFEEHNQLPSNQMVPRLLGNLWASKQSLNTGWNPTLFETEELS